MQVMLENSATKDLPKKKKKLASSKNNLRAKKDLEANLRRFCARETAARKISKRCFWNPLKRPLEPIRNKALVTVAGSFQEKHAPGAFGEAVPTGAHSERSPMEGRHRQIPHRSTTITNRAQAIRNRKANLCAT